MFTHMNPEGSLAIRLPSDELEKFLKKYKTTRSRSIRWRKPRSPRNTSR